MSFKHNAIFPEVDSDFRVKYTPTSKLNAGSDERTWELRTHCSDSHDEPEEEIFYLSFDDCRSADDKEGFLLMCSENELKELVNHLRMIRGV